MTTLNHFHGNVYRNTFTCRISVEGKLGNMVCAVILLAANTVKVMLTVVKLFDNS